MTEAASNTEMCQFRPLKFAAAMVSKRFMDRLAPLLIAAVVFASPGGMAADGAGVPLQLSNKILHDLTLQNLGTGTYEIRTTGGDPYLITLPLPPGLDVQREHVLAFEYFSTSGTDHLQVFALPPGDEDHSLKVEGLSLSEGWSAHAIELKPLLQTAGRKVSALRLDFGSRSGVTLQFRSLQLRPPTEREQELQARRDSQHAQEEELETHLRDYLHRSYPCAVTQVKVDEKQIVVAGEVGNQRGELFLAEAPVWDNVTELRQFPSIHPLHADPSGRFSIALDRRRRQNERERDRLLSRWAVVRKNGAGYELLSPARYADEIVSKWNLPEEKPRHKKGLGAFGHGRPWSDLDELDIAGVTVNVQLNGLFRSAPGEGRTAFDFGGRTWYAEERAIRQLDETLLEAAKHRLIVSAIILISQAQGSPDRAWGHLVAHPDAHPSGIYVMPNVSNEDGLEAYAAALDFLAQRYSRPDRQYGRIHHWIMHNEVDAGWEWTNAGEKTALLYLDLYHKSLRTAHLIARQYNPHAKVFVSLTHYWAKTEDKHFHPSKELLELLLEFSKVEGDFDWAIAYHAYPEDLRNPRVWADQQVDFTFNTPKITFKNIEVLDAWVKQPRACYLGQHRRTVHLTEQGLNSPDYSEKSLQDQAAGMAYAWNKIKHLETIELFHYHNWVDARAEGGLRIGLRKFPDEKTDPLGKKPVWFVYQALGATNEEAATAFAKPIVGIRDWREIVFPGSIK